MWPQDKTMGHPFVTLREWGNGKMSNASVRFLYINTCGTNRRNRRSVWNKQEEGEISAVTGLWPHCSYREGVEQLPWLECCHKWPHTAEEGWIRNTQSWIYPSQEAAALVVCWALSQGGWQERWEVMGQDQRAGWGGWHWSGCLLQAARAGGGREWELLQAPRNSLTVTHPASCGGISLTWHPLEKPKQCRRFLESTDDDFLSLVVKDPTRNSALLDFILTNSEGLFGAVNMGKILAVVTMRLWRSAMGEEERRERDCNHGLVI